MEIVRLNNKSIQYAKQLKNIRGLNTREDNLEIFVKDSKNLAYMAIEDNLVIGLSFSLSSLNSSSSISINLS